MNIKRTMALVVTIGALGVVALQVAGAQSPGAQAPGAQSSGAQSSGAQSSGVRRTDLQRHDLSVPGREAFQVRVDFDPGAAFGRHSHPGEEIIYVLDGLLEYEIDGKPPVRLKPGGVLFIPAGTIHAAKNVGSTIGAELATYIVEKGKPLVVLAK